MFHITRVATYPGAERPAADYSFSLWHRFGPDAYLQSYANAGGIYQTHPAWWEFATAGVFLCCGALLLCSCSHKFRRLLLFIPVVFGCFATIAQVHWMGLFPFGMEYAWIGPSPDCDEVARYALLSTHLGIVCS